MNKLIDFFVIGNYIPPESNYTNIGMTICFIVFCVLVFISQLLYWVIDSDGVYFPLAIIPFILIYLVDTLVWFMFLFIFLNYQEVLGLMIMVACLWGIYVSVRGGFFLSNVLEASAFGINKYYKAMVIRDSEIHNELKIYKIKYNEIINGAY